jgi:hypothetical protein
MMEALESRLCLSDAVACATPTVQLPSVNQTTQLPPAPTATLAVSTASTAAAPAHEFHEFHVGRHGAPALPAGGTYSVASYKIETSSADTSGDVRIEHSEWTGSSGVRFENDANEPYHADPQIGSGTYFAAPIITRHMMRGTVVIILPAFPGKDANPQTPGEFTPPTTPPGGTTDNPGGIITQPNFDQTGTGGVGATRVGRGHANSGTFNSVIGKTLAANETATETFAIQAPVTPVTAVVSAAGSSASRQALVDVLDGDSHSASLRTLGSSFRVESSSGRFESLTSAASSFGGVIAETFLQRVHFTLPTAGDIAANLEAAAAQAAARVVVTSQPAFEFAHMGSPFTLVADSLGAFIEDSASIPTAVARPTHSQGPWMLTFAVIAADVAVLTYMHRRGVKARKRLVTQ